jgi:hypothetical protein
MARWILGSTVIGGMLAFSGIAIFLVPLTFYLIEWLASKRRRASQRQSRRCLPPHLNRRHAGR